MHLRDIPPGMDPIIVAGIDTRLSRIRSDFGVSIPLAIESGSRAWGFPSPDSDYDCRFIFVRPADAYLSPWPLRDVIETPLDKTFDVNGWELGKALKLLLKGNAVVLEWLTSPIIYGAERQFRDEFLALAHRLTNRQLIARHYFHLGQRQQRALIDGAHSIPQKRIFYALRPAAALRWLRMHPDAPLAPMHFPSLLRECDPPPEVASIVTELVARKAVTRELGSEPVPRAIVDFVDTELLLGARRLEDSVARSSTKARLECEEFFRSTVKRVQ